MPVCVCTVPVALLKKEAKNSLSLPGASISFPPDWYRLTTDDTTSTESNGFK